MSERWKDVAERIESHVSGPTDEQSAVAGALGLELPGGTPAPVVAVVLRARLAEALRENLRSGVDVPETLERLEADLGISDRSGLITGTREEISAWFESRYMVITAKGLRDLKPGEGDVVTRPDNPAEHMVISSISDSGRVYMKGGRGKSAWPNHLDLVSRSSDDSTHGAMVAAVDAGIRNARSDYSPSSPVLDELAEFRVTVTIPTVDAIRELEDLLEGGESKEGPFQDLVERHPQLLASLVVGNWGTYIIPQQRLGAEHVTDFLVLGVNSLGPQWLAVELEAPRHELLTQKGALRSEVQHAVNQIQDWRDWLTANVSYAQGALHLHGLTNSVPGLVIIGRDEPRASRQPARSRVAEQQDIQIHSWDWVLRQAKKLATDGRQLSTAQSRTARAEELDI